MKNVSNIKTARLDPFSQQAILDHFKLIQTKAKRARSLRSFLKVLALFVDFIRTHPLFNNLLCKWKRDKQQGLNHLHSLELSVYKQ